MVGVFLIMTANDCLAKNMLSWIKNFTRNNTIDNPYKRSDTLDDERPCTCDSRVEWTDLGEHVYPRHLRQTTCISTHCWFGHNRCTQIYYTVRVLARKTLPHEDSLLPEALRSDWTFLDRIVSVGCLCGR